MNPYIIGGAVFIWILGIILGSAYQMQDAAIKTIDINGTAYTLPRIVDTIASFKVINWTTLAGPVKFPTPNIDYFVIIGKMGTWDFPFLNAKFEYVKMLGFTPFQVILGLMFIALFVYIYMSLLNK